MLYPEVIQIFHFYLFVCVVLLFMNSNQLNVEQLLLGREVVFDKFNIEFRQAEEQIIFTWRKDNLTH